MRNGLRLGREGRSASSFVLLVLTCTGALGGGAERVASQQHESVRAVYGFVRDAETGEPVVGAQVILAARRAAFSDRAGYFAIPSVPPGSHEVVVAALGYARLDTVAVVTRDDPPIEFLLTPQPIEISALQVEVTRRSPGEPGISTGRVTPREIRRVPAALQADLFRSLQALPGIIAPDILSSSLLVRGGASDQNLFLLDGYPVINPHHLGGIFSTFLIDAVQDVRYWIGTPPARFGRRLSSVIDIRLRDGNREELDGSAAVGLVSTAGVAEGPHPLGAWMVGARRTYIDNITRVVDDPVPYYFYDLYAKAYADISPYDRISGLLFLGRDRVWRPRGDRPDVDEFDWTNWVTGVSWRHLFGGRAVFEQRFSATGYSERLREVFIDRQRVGAGTRHEVSRLSLSGRLEIVAFGADHHVELGYEIARRRDSHTTVYDYGDPRIDPDPARSAASSGVFLAGYLEDVFSPVNRLRVRLGIRGEKLARYTSVQPRFAADYRLNDDVTFLFGVGTLRQYLHRVEDPDAPLLAGWDVNIWMSANENNVEPASVTHLTAGVKAGLPWDLQFRAEAYAKRFDNMLNVGPYKPSFRIIAIDRLRWADGTARGLDVSLDRSGPHRVQGWLGYSVASSRRQAGDDTFAATPYPRQRFVTVLDMRIDERRRITARFEAMEGVPYTPALAMVIDRPYDFGARRFTQYCFALTPTYVYGEYNSARTGLSKRLDIGFRYTDDDDEGWFWEIGVSLLNALADPVGVFRPAEADPREGCSEPIPVLREHELLLPPIPSVTVRIEF